MQALINNCFLQYLIFFQHALSYFQTICCILPNTYDLACILNSISSVPYVDVPFIEQHDLSHACTPYSGAPGFLLTHSSPTTSGSSWDFCRQSMEGGPCVHLQESRSGCSCLTMAALLVEQFASISYQNQLEKCSEIAGNLGCCWELMFLVGETVHSDVPCPIRQG